MWFFCWIPFVVRCFNIHPCIIFLTIAFISFLVFHSSSFLSIGLSVWSLSCRRYDNDDDDTVGELGLHTLTRELSSLDPTPSISRAPSIKNLQDSATTATQEPSNDQPHLTIDPLAEPISTETEPLSINLPLSNNNIGTPSRGGSAKPTARGSHPKNCHFFVLFTPR